MEYHPLCVEEGEIRVVTILPRKDESFLAEKPIRCTLEHVKLDEKSRGDSCKAVESAKGAGRV